MIRLKTSPKGPTVDDINPALPLRTLHYGNYGIFLSMDNYIYIYIYMSSAVCNYIVECRVTLLGIPITITIQGPITHSTVNAFRELDSVLHCPGFDFLFVYCRLFMLMGLGFR